MIIKALPQRIGSSVFFYKKKQRKEDERMKKKVLTITVTGLILSTVFSGCGKGKDQIAQDVYTNINNAYENIQDYANDIYDACHLGIYKNEDLTVDEFTKEVAISEDEMVNAIKVYFAGNIGEDEIEKLMDGTDEDILPYVMLKTFVSLAKPNNMGIIIQNVYNARGTTKEIESDLEKAKAGLKSLNSDAEYYDSLKSYYTTMTSYYDFCEHLTGTFGTMKDTVNDYESDIRKYKNDLELAIDE